LLVVILMTGPLVLGAARLWIELPLLVGVAFLLLIQGLRLARPAPSGSYRLVDAIDLAVIVFLLYTIGRWLTSPAEYFSRLEAMNVFAYAVIFFTCRYGLAQRSHGLALLFFLVTLGIGETIFGYLFSHHSYLGDPASLWFPFGPTERLHLHYAPRWLGTYGCPNHYVSLLVMASGAALALGSFSKLSWPLRIVLFYFAGIMAIGVAYSGSRGGWVAFVAMLIALMIFGLRYGMIRWWLPVVSSLVFFVFFACLFGTSRDVLFRFQDAGNTMGGLGKYVRIELDEDALRIAQDYPVIGSGPATFAFIHPRYQRSDFGYKAVLTHDDYLNCLDDYGLVGFGLAMFFVAAVTIKFFGRLRADNRWHDRVMVATGFAAWCALLFHSTVDFNLHIPANALLLFALTGLALGRIATTQVSFSHWSTLSLAPLGRWLGWFLIMISFTYGALVVRTWLSDRIYEQVADSARVLPTDQSVLDAQQALRIDPGNVQALVLLGDLYRYQASRQRDIEGRVQFGQQALDAYARALRINTLDDTVVARQGMTFDVMRRYSEAFFCYSAAVRAQPYNGQFWNVLGNHYWQRNLLEKAEQAYRMASRCPHGFEGSGQAIKELRVLLDAEGVPPPPPGTNPLLPRPEPEDVPTTP
jgi:O-antigen ligase